MTNDQRANAIVLASQASEYLSRALSELAVPALGPNGSHDTVHGYAELAHTRLTEMLNLIRKTKSRAA
jgi:hypothetical protein